MNINFRIVGASVVGILLVGGAFVLAEKNQEYVDPDPRLGVVAGPAPERSFIETEDKNGDGVADWREPFATLDTDRVIATGTASTTETGRIAIDTIASLMNARMEGGIAISPEDIVERANFAVAQLAMDTLYTKADIVVSPQTSTAVLHAYGNRVAQITFDNAVEGEVRNEIDILKDVTEGRNAEALEEFTPIIEGYEGMVNDMLATPVPQAYVKEHLDLVNTYNAILQDIKGFKLANDDPLVALARVKRYNDDTRGLFQAIVNLYTKLHEDGITWTEYDVVLQLIDIEP